MCEAIELKDNAMLIARPELIYEWNFEKNNELGLNVYEVTKGSTKKVFWECEKCKSSYFATIANRVNGKGCPYCRGLKANKTNSFATLHPELAEEWNISKNGSISPNDITARNDKKVWWEGVCGHEWESVIRSRVLGSGCPYCSHNSKTLKGFNDLWTTHPTVASWLFDCEDGYRYSRGSSKKVDWKCPDCKAISKQKSPEFIIRNNSIPCKNCSDGFSYPEKVVYNILIDNNIDFEAQKTFEWSRKCRYDFYITSLNWILEVHGLQHYQEVKFSNSNKRNLKYQKDSDDKKEALALKNGIEKYIVLDSSVSGIDFIVESIMDSELKDIIVLINKESIDRRSCKSSVILACELWNNGNCSTDIASKLKIHHGTARNYLKKGVQIGLCNYSAKECRLRSGLKNGSHKKIVQFDKNKNVVKVWNTLTEIGIELGINSDTVSLCCREKRDSYKGCIWEYLEN